MSGSSDLFQGPTYTNLEVALSGSQAHLIISFAGEGYSSELRLNLQDKILDPYSSKHCDVSKLQAVLLQSCEAINSIVLNAFNKRS